MLRSTDMLRPGYSPDEEITYFAVQGIDERGIPILPSGAFYERGLPYSYLAWVAGTLFGHSVPIYRLPSFLFGLLGILAAFFFTRRAAGVAAALLAASLLCIAPTFVVYAQWARQYTMFVVFSLLTIGLADAARVSPKWLGPFLASLCLTRGLHELAVTLGILPLFYCFSATSPSARKQALKLLAGTVAVLAASQLAVYGAHVWLSDPEMRLAQHHANIHRTATFSLPFHPIVREMPFGWLALAALFAVGIAWLTSRPSPHEGISRSFIALASAELQYGLVVFATLFAVMSRPSRAWSVVRFALAATACSLGVWALYAARIYQAPLSFDFAKTLAQVATTPPWDAAFFFARLWPLATLGVCLVPLAVIVRRPSEPNEHDEDDEHDALLRGTWCVMLFGFFLLGILQMGLRPRHFIFLLAIAFTVVPAAALWPSRIREKRLALTGVVATLVLGSLVLEQHRAIQRTTLVESRPRAGFGPRYTFRSFPTSVWRSTVGPIADDTTIVCTDELACLYAFGRVDYWLLTAEHDRMHFAVRVEGTARGVYAGARVIATVAELRSTVVKASENAECLILLTATGKFSSPSPEVVLAELSSALDRDAYLEESTSLAVIRVTRTD